MNMWIGRRRARFDVAYLGDFRSDAAIIGSVADEIVACGSAGYRTALIPAKGQRRVRNAPVHPAIRSVIRDGRAVVVPASEEAVEARLVILHAPLLEGPEGVAKARVRAGCSVIVAHEAVHGPADGAPGGAETLAAAARAHFGGEAVPASPWPAASQGAGSAAGAAADLLHWAPVVDAARLARGEGAPRGRFPVVGRHGPPDKAAWPQGVKSFLEAFPIGADLDVRLMGVPSEILAHFGGACPSNWTVYDHGWMPPDRFLREVDFFIHPETVRPGGRGGIAALEAIASGAVTALPRALAGLFEDGAIYPAPGVAMVGEVALLHRDRARYREQVGRGRALLARRHDPRLHQERLRALIGKPRAARGRGHRFAARKRAAPAARAHAVLFVATNGIGLGHLVQLMSIARRLPDDVKPVFVTNSQAICAVRRAGYPVHFLPDDRYTECNTKAWNLWLERELDQLIDLHRAAGLVFSGVWCFDGVIRAGAWREAFPMAWVRIPMWKRALWDQSVERAKYFDLVIDTGEVAARRNVGARIPYDDRVAAVPPLLLCDEAELLGRDEARRRLGLRPEGPAVLLQLGAGNNTALTPVIEHVVRVLRSIGPFQIIIAEWIITDRELDLWPDIVRLRDFPNAPYLPAFDFVMSASGYNTFHELVGYGVPTVFVPSERQETDDQLRRAQFADEEGLAFCVRAGELHRLDDVLAAIARPDVRAQMRAACRRHFPGNGSAVAAGLIADLMRRRPAPGGRALAEGEARVH